MRLEKEIQSWLLEVVGVSDKDYGDPTRDKRTLKEVIEFGGTSLDDEIRDAVEHGDVIPRAEHPAAYEACRILRSFIDPVVEHGERNVSFEPKSILRTDLVLRDVGYSDAFVVVEIKRSASAAREAVTELLAYANAFRARYRHAEVFLVLISTSWKPPEKASFRELARSGYPFLPLEYIEHDVSPKLRVRADLLPHPRDALVQEEGLLVRSSVFAWPLARTVRHWPAEWTNRVVHHARVLKNRAQSTRQTGFVLAWILRQRGQLFISVASCSPYAVDMFKYNEIAEEIARPADVPNATRANLAAAWASRPDGYNDDAAFRVLYESDFGIDAEERAESEGNWPVFQQRLIDDQAEILFFDAYGDLGDRLDWWRMTGRKTLAPAVPDLTTLPTSHPITWLPLLDSLLINDRNTRPDASAWGAFQAGETTATFIDFQRAGHLRSPRTYAWMATQARFAVLWSQVADSRVHDYKVHLSSGQVFAPEATWNSVVELLEAHFASIGLLEYYCYLLGHFKGHGQCSTEYLAAVRRQLDDAGLQLPAELHAVEEMAQRGIAAVHMRP